MSKNVSRLQFPIISIIILFGLAAFFSLFTLWIIESWIKYPLFVLEISAIVVTYFILNSGYDLFKFPLKIQPNLQSIRVSRIVEYFDSLLVCFASFLLFLNLLRIEGGTSQLLLALICSSILSGYVILRIFGISQYLSRLEIAVLSFLLSFIFSGFLTLSLLSVDENTRSIVMPLLFLLPGAVSILLKRRRNIKNKGSYTNQPSSLSNNIDILPLALCIIFCIVFYFLTYPNAALLPATDASRHYSYSAILSRTPDVYAGNVLIAGDVYSGFGYFLFHAFQASLHIMSGLNQTIIQFQTIQIALNLFLPLSFYILARRFFEDIDKRIPALSTLFYTVFSNFSFIYFVQLKLLNTGNTDFQVLAADVAEKSYSGIINFMQPLHFFTPFSVAFMLFISGFLLLRIPNLPRYRFIGLYSVLIFAMYYTHLPEAVVFVSFVSAYSFISKSKRVLRLDDALVSLLIGSILASIFFAYTSFVWKSDLRDIRISTIGILSFILPVVFVIGSLLWRQKVLFRIKLPLKYIDSLNSTKFFLAISVSLVAIYLFGFLTWLTIEDFKTSLVSEIGVVPWFIYPLLLGIVGLLALLSIKYMGNILPNSVVVMVLSAILFIFVLGRIVSFVSTNIVVVDYWEKRFPGLIFPFACLLAPIPLIKFRDHLKAKTKKLADPSVIALICLLVISGYSSMVLQSEYWFTRVNGLSEKVSKNEFEAIGYLNDLIRKDRYAFTISPSTQSHDIIAFASPAYQSSEPQVLASSKYPDIGLFTLASHNLDHAYLYMHDRDFRTIRENPQGWLAGHLIPMLPIVYSNEEVTIYNITKISYPLPNSNAVLLVPSDSRANSWFYAYDVISQSGKNYTVMYDNDPSALKAKSMILSYDPVEYYNLYDNFSSSNNKWNVVSGTWNYSSDGLHVGEMSKKAVENVILSPVTSTSTKLNISTSFVIKKLDQDKTNYVSIIYSWINPENYRYAGVLFHKNSTYIYLANVSNGVRSQDPAWPGLKVELDWNPGDVLNLALSTEDGSEELVLNGSKSLQREFNNKIQGSNAKGTVGLSYGKISNMTFDTFDLKDLERLNLREISDYIRYVQSGGHLTVLNTNRHPGSIANYLNDSHEVKKIKVLTIIDKPLIRIMEGNIGHGTIRYVNLEPVLSGIERNDISAVTAYKILGMISGLIINGRSTDSLSPSLSDIAVIFREMNGTSSTVNINTTSAIFPSNLALDDITIYYGRNNKISLTDITKLNFEHYSHVALQGMDSSFSLKSGRGLYSTLAIGNNSDDNYRSSFNLTFIDNASVQVSTPTSSNNFGNVSSIQVVDRNPLEIDMRQPTIDIVNGNIILEELYPRGQLYEKTGALGDDLKVEGNISLSLYMSDSYTLARQLSIDGVVQRIPPLSEYDEVKSFISNTALFKLSNIPVTVLGILAVPFLIAAVLLIVDRPKMGKIV